MLIVLFLSQSFICVIDPKKYLNSIMKIVNPLIRLALVSHLMATLLPSITMGLKESLSSLLSSLLWGDDAATGTCRVGPAVWRSPLGTTTDIVVTGPCLPSRLAPILTSSPRTLSVSMLGPNFCWTAWTWAVEYPSLWKKSSWASRGWWSEDGSDSLGYIFSQEGREQFWVWRSEGKIHAGVLECERFREDGVGSLLHWCTDEKAATSTFISSSCSTCLGKHIWIVSVSCLQTTVKLIFTHFIYIVLGGLIYFLTVPITFLGSSYSCSVKHSTFSR